MIEEILKEHNLKITHNRVKLLNYLKEQKKSTFKDIKKYMNIKNDSTIYRIIDVLEKNSIIIKSLNNKEVVYIMNEYDDDHFIECIKCHTKKRINICPIKMLDETDFTIIRHNIKIEGICNKCKRDS